MSRSESVRAELAAIDPTRECCRLAEIAGLALTAGRPAGDDAGDQGLRLDLSAAAIARRAFGLLRSFGVTATVTPYERPAFGRETRYALDVATAPRALQVLEEAGVLDATLCRRHLPPKRVVRRGCCRASFLRGALLGGGSVSGPRDPHVELRVGTRGQADFTVDVAAEAGLELAVVERERHVAVYVKGVEATSDLLALVGAHGEALGLTEATVLRATRARANRLANADHANLVRSSRSAQAQIRSIRRLELAGALESLPPELVEIARLRLANPTLSLRELGARCEPPAPKATAHRRLRRLEHLGRG